MKMTKTIRARYGGGVFKPLDPIQVEEGTEVTITVETTESSEAVSPFDACFGGWDDLVDTDTLLHDIYEHRVISSSREVDF